VTELDRITIHVTGRPAPQGSKRLGEHGQMREQSAYLPAWRAAVHRAVYERYHELGIAPETTKVKGWALLRGPVSVSIEFRLDTGQRVDGPPDLDKLARSTWDALTAARVWEDDGRVVDAQLLKVAATELYPAGAVITVMTEV
jgi:Holliday junction resolvase RusA-like endonuclease